MTPADEPGDPDPQLAEIHALYVRAKRAPSGPSAGKAIASIPWLVEEIERLRAALADRQIVLDQNHAYHAEIERLRALVGGRPATPTRDEVEPLLRGEVVDASPRYGGAPGELGPVHIGADPGQFVEFYPDCRVVVYDEEALLSRSAAQPAEQRSDAVNLRVLAAGIANGRPLEDGWPEKLREIAGRLFAAADASGVAAEPGKETTDGT